MGRLQACSAPFSCNFGRYDWFLRGGVTRWTFVCLDSNGDSLVDSLQPADVTVQLLSLSGSCGERGWSFGPVLVNGGTITVPVNLTAECAPSVTVCLRLCGILIHSCTIQVRVYVPTVCILFQLILSCACLAGYTFGSRCVLRRGPLSTGVEQNHHPLLRIRAASPLHRNTR